MQSQKITIRDKCKRAASTRAAELVQRCEFRAAKSRDGRRTERRNNENSIAFGAVESWNGTEVRATVALIFILRTLSFVLSTPADLAALAAAHTLSAMKTFVRGEDRTSSRLHVSSSRISSVFCFTVFFFLCKNPQADNALIYVSTI